MSCPSCGSPLAPGARFCGVCGTRIDAMRPGGGVSKDQTLPMPPGGHVSAPPVIEPQRARVAAPGQVLGPPAAGRPMSTPMPAAGLGPLRGGDPFIGKVLNGRFRVDSKIGEGGFGAVYRGVQQATGRKVALKVLHPEMTRDENLVARFRREGQVLCNLRDAHTITTYDFDQTPEGTLYLAMELLEGKSLHQVFHDEAPVQWRRMFKILAEMCSSLAEAHAQGIVHRDLKPENIYLEQRPGNPEFVKILDFGIAKVMRGDGAMDPSAPALTATGQTLGTLEYMSPEQLMGKALDGRSDIYTLGVLTYEMVTGRLPFPDAKGPAGLITAQLKQTPQPPSQTAKGQQGQIPPSVDAIILRCLEKDKNKRFADASQLAGAIAECLAALGGTPPRTRPPDGATAPMGGPMAPAMSPAPLAANVPRASTPPNAAAHVPSPRRQTPGPGTSELIAQAKGGRLMWIVLAILVLGAGIGAVLAYAL